MQRCCLATARSSAHSRPHASLLVPTGQMGAQQQQLKTNQQQQGTSDSTISSQPPSSHGSGDFFHVGLLELPKTRCQCPHEKTFSGSSCVHCCHPREWHADYAARNGYQLASIATKRENLHAEIIARRMWFGNWPCGKVCESCGVGVSSLHSLYSPSSFCITFVPPSPPARPHTHAGTTPCTHRLSHTAFSLDPVSALSTSPTFSLPSSCHLFPQLSRFHTLCVLSFSHRYPWCWLQIIAVLCGTFFFFFYVYWEGKVLLYMYPTSLYREEG
jgi:hypothetical protein